MKTTLGTYMLAAGCGVLLALAFPTWHWYPLAWVALIPLFYFGATRKPFDAARLFFVSGWVFYSVLLQWLMSNIYWAGGWAIWGYQLLCVFMALYWGLFGLLWTWMHQRAPKWAGALAAAALWAGMESLQATLFTGFGWGCLAHSQGTNEPLIQWASLGGAACVSAIIVLFNALVGLIFAEQRLRVVRIGAAVGVIAISHGVGSMLVQPADYDSMPLRVGLVQADFPLEMKWDPEYTAEMVRNSADKSRRLAQHEQVDLFVWPESLVMAPLDAQPELLNLVGGLCRESNSALFTGSERANASTEGIWNSSFLLDASGAIVDHYDKVHLAPFGEYVPMKRYIPFVGRIVPAIGDIEPGEQLKVLCTGNRCFGPLICFEVLFGDIAEKLRAQGADFLVVITNLGWFGVSNAIPQELEIARVRAIETRLPVVHCANSGISGVFDPWGRFCVVNATFDAQGRYVPFRVADPNRIIMNRCVGALPVAAPGPRLLPGGPRIFPWAAGALSLVMVLVSLAYPQAPARDQRVFVNR